MEGRYVAITDNPFRVVAQREAVKTLKEMDGAIAPTRTENSARIRVEQSRLKVGITLRVSARISLTAFESVLTHIRHPALVGKHRKAIVDQLRLHDS